LVNQDPKWKFRSNRAAAALRVHASSQIARTRADFERFSEMSENLETGWWSKRDLNSRPLFIKYPAECAVFFAQFRRTSPSENLFANDSTENIANGRGTVSSRSC
jgi:hypothetical protein